LSVTFTPDDAANYTGATASVSINVLKATPVITWPTPADIIYGVALGRAPPPPAGHLSPARRRQLPRRDGERLDQRPEGDAGHHLADPRGHHLRRRAEHDPAERDDHGARHLRLHA